MRSFGTGEKHSWKPASVEVHSSNLFLEGLLEEGLTESHKDSKGGVLPGVRVPPKSGVLLLRIKVTSFFSCPFQTRSDEGMEGEVLWKPWNLISRNTSIIIHPVGAIVPPSPPAPHLSFPLVGTKMTESVKSNKKKSTLRKHENYFCLKTLLIYGSQINLGTVRGSTMAMAMSALRRGESLAA